MKVRTAAQILWVGAGVNHELMKRRFSPSIRLKSKRQVGMIDTMINRFPLSFGIDGWKIWDMTTQAGLKDQEFHELVDSLSVSGCSRNTC
jgi:hypothetical protein